jgi:predicted GNAT family acetyltransferase
MLPGVSGLPENCQAFATLWQELSRQPYHRSMAQRIYQLEKVNPIAPVTGRFRRARESDRRLLLDWMIAFSVEAFEGTDPDVARLERNVESMLTSKIRGAYIWDDGQPVSFSAYGGPTPHGCRLGPVYTPPEYRGKGYASACVATLSQHLLDTGRKFVFLYTDLANPTSNHIYQVIGYNPVCDADVYEFEPFG